MSFQEIALFDSLTVAENVGYRLYEETDLSSGQGCKKVLHPDMAIHAVERQ